LQTFALHYNLDLNEDNDTNPHQYTYTTHFNINLILLGVSWWISNLSRVSESFVMFHGVIELNASFGNQVGSWLGEEFVKSTYS
jgi:hypothetical protein